MSRRRHLPRTALAVAAAGGAAAAGWVAQNRRDRQRVLADPEHAALTAPLQGEEIAVRSAAGTQIHVETFGPAGAPAIVLVHGWTCSIRFWTRQIQELSKDFHVIAYDHRGHGRSERSPGGSYSTEVLAHDLQAVLAACVPAGQRAVVAGHSMGGMTIVAWAGEYPEEVGRRVGAAALVNTGMGDLATNHALLPPLLAGANLLAHQILSLRLPAPQISTPIGARAIAYVALGPGATPAQAAFTERLVLACPGDVRGGWGAALSRLNLYEALASLTVPTLLIAGEKDRLTPLAHAERMAKELPNVLDVVEIPGVGHMAPYEAPDVVNARLADLVRQVERETIAAA